MLNQPVDEQKRRALLFMEAAGILHDMGKLHDFFLKSMASDASGFTFAYWAVVDPRQVIPGSTPVAEAAPLIDLTMAQSNGLLQARFDFRGNAYSIAQLLITHKGSSPHFNANDPLSLLLNTVHGSSHYEKELNEADPYGRQPYDDMKRISPFGVETKIDTDQTPELTRLLQSLPIDKLDDILSDGREKKLEELQAILRQGLADTRRGLADVTLWDWGWTVGSFAKAALAGEFYTGSPINPSQVSWRILRLNLDMLGLLSRTATLADLIGLRDTIEASLKEARQVIEQEWALGNQIYSDMTGSYFVLPDVQLPARLERDISACFDDDLQVQIALEPDTVLSSNLNPRAGGFRSEARRLVVAPLSNARELLRRPDLSQFASVWDHAWQSADSAEVCVACGLRPQGFLDQRVTERWARDPAKAKARKLCCVCLQRRGRRSQLWTQSTPQSMVGDTIWLNEIADINGRAALLVGYLGIEAWMDSPLVETLHLRRPRPGRDDSKSPSPARLARMRRTCLEFWQDIEREDILSELPGRKRWFLIPTLADRQILDRHLGDYHVYELVLARDIVLPVVWDSEHRRLLTAGNLDYVAQGRQPQSTAENPREALRRLTRGVLAIREPGAALGSREERLLMTTIEEVTEAPDYSPFARVLLRPENYLALLPAADVLGILRRIQQRYIDVFGRVRDRLPIRIGVVFAPRATPLRASLEAGRAMLNGFDALGWEEWELETADPELGTNVTTHRVLHFVNGIAWTVPNDEFYPYFFTDPQRQRASLRHLTQLRLQPINRQTGQRIAGRGEKVQVRPSTLDLEFLDTSARRFEIAYDARGRRRGRPTRPYLLEELAALDDAWEAIAGPNGLSNSQIHALRDTIEDKRAAWQPTAADCAGDAGMFWQFCRDAILTAQWPKGRRPTGAPLRRLTDWAARGLLADVIELRMGIMKESAQRSTSKKESTHE